MSLLRSTGGAAVANALWRFWKWAIFGPEKLAFLSFFHRIVLPTPKPFRLGLLLPKCSPNTASKFFSSEQVQCEKRIGLYAHTILSFFHQSETENISPSMI